MGRPPKGIGRHGYGKKQKAAHVRGENGKQAAERIATVKAAAAALQVWTGLGKYCRSLVPMEMLIASQKLLLLVLLVQLALTALRALYLGSRGNGRRRGTSWLDDWLSVRVLVVMWLACFVAHQPWDELFMGMLAEGSRFAA